MQVQEIVAVLSASGAVLGLAGSVVLAFSLDATVRHFRTRLLALDTSVESLAGQGPMVVFTGWERQELRVLNTSQRWVRVGVALLALCFVCQLLSIGAPILLSD